MEEEEEKVIIEIRSSSGVCFSFLFNFVRTCCTGQLLKDVGP